MSNQHVARRVGQRWKSDAILGDGPYVVEGTLARHGDFGRLGGGWHIVDTLVNGKPRDDGGYVFYDSHWDERTMTLLSDAPPDKPAVDRAKCKAPAVGWRFKSPATGNVCRVLVTEEDDEEGETFVHVTWETGAGSTKWPVDEFKAKFKERLEETPPLESKPAETGIDYAVPGSERTRHRCTGCEWFIDTTCMDERDVTRLVLEHLAKDHNAPPAQEVPKSTRIYWYDVEGRGHGPYSSQGRCDHDEAAYLAWMAVQSGTSAAELPERIVREKMAHVAGADDDDLVAWSGGYRGR